ncbi:hypothetical protein [uncultured Shewanella sp.]|nr:hypothetical protein [uncultured Shewanella sp.]
MSLTQDAYQWPMTGATLCFVCFLVMTHDRRHCLRDWYNAM